MSADASDFSVSLSGAREDRCNADNCAQTPTLVATLVYCFCDREPDEHGHPGSEDSSANRYSIAVCEKHGSLIAHFWECFESLRNHKAAEGVPA